MSDNHIGEEGVLYLSQCLEVNTTIEEIYLSNNYINEKRITFLCDSLKLNNSLKILDISNNYCSIESTKKIISLFEVNQTIVELNLGNNSMDEDSINLFFNSLESNKTIESLGMIGNYMRDGNFVCLINLLKKNKMLKKIDLSFHLDHSEYLREINFLLSCNIGWSPFDFLDSVDSFKDSILSFLLSLKFIQNKYAFRVPKFVLFEIFKNVDRKAYSLNKKNQFFIWK